MKEKLQQIRERALQEIHESKELGRLNEVRDNILGKKGELTSVLRGMKDVAPEDRPKVGQWVNETRAAIEEVLEEKIKKFQEEELQRKYKSEKIDVTMPAKQAVKGNLHPITQVRNQLIDIFGSMGFEIYEGPEIEDDDHNFTRLNVPKNHPARDMQDTFYVADDIVLRTQTSGGQIRVMDMEKPPIKVLVPGRVFRSDSDATHSPMFHQMEGLVVDKGITLCDLQGMLDKFVQALFGPEAAPGTPPAFRSAQEEAMLLYEDDEEESDD